MTATIISGGPGTIITSSERAHLSDTGAVSVPDGLDLVWGAEAIAEVLGRTRRSTFHLLEAGELPAKKVGGRWVASRKKLRELFEGEAA